MRIEMSVNEFNDVFSPHLTPPVDVFAKALATAKSGLRLQAIKDLRETYGFGLKQAKDLIDIAVPVSGDDWR
jgi:ribosomal protein L7/L12